MSPGSDPAREALARDDAAARARAQRCFDRALVIEAGAGTGKTSVLVARIVAWCLGPGWERAAGRLRGDGDRVRDEAIADDVLQRVVAITFTEAAAAEMEARVARALFDLGRGADVVGVELDALPTDASRRGRRARTLLGAFDRLHVRTIHAFCRRLLAEHPLEAGLHPRFEIDARGHARAAVAREVLEERLREGARGEDADLLALVERDVAAPQLETLLVAQLAQGIASERFGADPLAPERVRELGARLRAAAGELERVAAAPLATLRRGSVPLAVCDALAATRARLAELPEKPADLSTCLDSLRDAWPANVRKRVRDWARDCFLQGEEKALGADRDAVRAAAASLDGVLSHALALDVELLALLHRVLAPLLARSEARLRARGAESFDALLRRTEALLSSHPRVAARVRAGIEQLLVDEFQDTDRLQCEILRRLALEGEERPGLFLVGDPKQSIYGWRNADLGAYSDFVNEVLEETAAERHRLAVNHRSVPSVLAEVEAVMAPVMRPLPGVQPAFEPLLASDWLAATAEDLPAVEYWVSTRWEGEPPAPAATAAGAATELEATWLARDLARRHEQLGTRWSDSAVLLRSTGDLDVVLEALRRAGVPYTVDRDRAYYRRREVVEASALVRAALDPNDQIALVATLRSAWVGVPDAAWQPLWNAGFPDAVRDRLLERDDRLAACLERARAAVVPDAAPGLDRLAGWDVLLARAVDVLAELRRSFREEPLPVFLETLRTLPGLEVAEAARHLGVYRLANLDRFFRELGETIEASGGDASAVLRALRRDASEDPEVEEGRPRDPSEDAVQVMTIHRAKGLDFEHVYLLQLHKEPAAGERAAFTGDDDRGRFEFRLQAGGVAAASLGYDRVAARRDAVARAEQVRTLYVAMTRARRRLVLAGRLTRPGRDSHAALLESGRGAELAHALDALPPGADAWRGEGPRWVFPGLGEATLPRVEQSGALPDVGPARVQRDAERLRELRAAAAARAQRSLGGPVTESAANERREAAVGTAPDDPQPRRGRHGDRETATAIGTAVHRLLERFDWRAEPEAEWARQRARLDAWLARELAGERLEAGRRRAAALLEALRRGPLWERLGALAPRIVARELPVLVRPDPDRGGPVGAVVGAIDLLYRDPATDELVVADFKTDRVCDAADARRRAGRYRAQGALYQQAVREALDLPRPPRFELWFLDGGQIETGDAPDHDASGRSRPS